MTIYIYIDKSFFFILFFYFFFFWAIISIQPYTDKEHRSSMPTVHLLDYVAGNIRSLVNAINKVGYDVEWIRSPQDIQHASVRELSL